MVQVVLKPENLSDQLRISANDLREENSLQEQLGKAYEQDSFLRRELDAVRQCTPMGEITVAECWEKDR
jgi:hypothetical protein